MLTPSPLFTPSSCDDHRRGLSSTPLVVTLLLLATGVAVGAWRFWPWRASPQPQVITHTVQRGLFLFDVIERGEVESSNNLEVRCEVKSRNTGGIAILDVVDEGAPVKPGDILVRLDSSALEQERVQQQIVCNTAEALMIQSKNTFEAAEIAKKEYIEGTFFQDEQAIQSDIFIAEENLRRAREYVTYSERLAARGYVTAQQLEGDAFAVEKAETELETAKTKLRVLREYTKPKMVKQLDSDIKSAEAKWKSDQSSYELELSKLKDIEDQIDKCTIRAPSAGQVVYANVQSWRGEGDFIVEAGVLVREGQVIIRLPDAGKMQVKAKINESRVTPVRVGMQSTIRLDAFGDERLKGEVVRVNEYPEPTSWYSSQVKEYATYVRIDDPPPTIRPGLTAEVTIHVQRTPDALLIPVQGVFEHGGKTYCMIQRDQDWSAEEIELGTNNEQFALVSGGLDEGEVIALNPRVLLEHVELPEVDRVASPRGEPREMAALPLPQPPAAAQPPGGAPEAGELPSQLPTAGQWEQGQPTQGAATKAAGGAAGRSVR